jgi:chromosome segregation ATPase
LRAAHSVEKGVMAESVANTASQAAAELQAKDATIAALTDTIDELTQKEHTSAESGNQAAAELQAKDATIAALTDTIDELTEKEHKRLAVEEGNAASKLAEQQQLTSALRGLETNLEDANARLDAERSSLAEARSQLKAARTALAGKEAVAQDLERRHQQAEAGLLKANEGHLLGRRDLEQRLERSMAQCSELEKRLGGSSAAAVEAQQATKSALASLQAVHEQQVGDLQGRIGELEGAAAAGAREGELDALALERDGLQASLDEMKQKTAKRKDMFEKLVKQMKAYKAECIKLRSLVQSSGDAKRLGDASAKSKKAD